MNKEIIVALALLTLGCTKQTTPPEPPPSEMIAGEYKCAGTNLMPNGGGTGTQDWDGRGQPWSIQWGKGGTNKGSIYWTGNYMAVSSKTAYSQMLLTSPRADVQSQWHVLTMKYMSDTKVLIAVQYSDNCTYIIATLQPCTKPQTVSVRFWAPKVNSLRLYNLINNGGTLYLDTVNLYDI